MKKIFVSLIFLLCLGLSAYFGYRAYEEYKPVMKADIQKEAIKKIAIIEDADSPYNRFIDFEALKQINKDIVGWIYIPDTSIDYPILVGSDDTEYEKKDMEGNYSILGSIFSYADTSRELSDARTVLFGHNMRQLTMFGELRYYLEDEFRSEHKKMYVYTEKKTMELDVFSVFVCSDTDEIFWDSTILGSAEYQELLQELNGRNQYTDIKKDTIADFYNNQAFSLVTCRGNAGTSKRLVVNAITVKEKYLLD